MKYLFYTLLVLILLAVNTQVTGLFAYAFFHVNLLLIICVFVAMEKKGYDFLFFAVFSGLLLDIYSPQNFGNYGFNLLFITWIVNWVVKNFLVYEINIKISIILLVFAYGLSEGLLWLSGMIFNFSHGIYNSNLSLLNVFLYEFIGVFVYLLFAFPLYFVWQKVSWVVKRLDIQAIS